VQVQANALCGAGERDDGSTRTAYDAELKTDPKTCWPRGIGLVVLEQGMGAAQGCRAN
jgi:hypothetical protein